MAIRMAALCSEEKGCLQTSQGNIITLAGNDRPGDVRSCACLFNYFIQDFTCTESTEISMFYQTLLDHLLLGQAVMKIL